MAKSKGTKKKTAKARKPAVKKTEKKPQREELCVFVFRLTPKEREDIARTADNRVPPTVFRAAIRNPLRRTASPSPLLRTTGTLSAIAT
jgi:hypothetical protein